MEGFGCAVRPSGGADGLPSGNGASSGSSLLSRAIVKNANDFKAAPSSSLLAPAATSRGLKMAERHCPANAKSQQSHSEKAERVVHAQILFLCSDSTFPLPRNYSAASACRLALTTPNLRIMKRTAKTGWDALKLTGLARGRRFYDGPGRTQ